MGKSEAVRLLTRLLQREAGLSSFDASELVHRALTSAGLQAHRYLDDLDVESLLYYVSLEGGVPALAAGRISRARAAEVD